MFIAKIQLQFAVGICAKIKMQRLNAVWAIYNMLRFRGRQRRKPRAVVAPEDLANMYGFSTETVNAWQNAKTLVMHHDVEGHLTDVKVS